MELGVRIDFWNSFLLESSLVKKEAEVFKSRENGGLVCGRLGF